MSSSEHCVPSVAGMKRSASGSAPMLLPAFEPYSSSPTLPPAKRVNRAPMKHSPSKEAFERHAKARAQARYPTPVATSSTGIMSSPPQLAASRRPPAHRMVSALSERTPLSSVPTIELDPKGVPTLMGRSGRSSNYQLSTDKLISRVHVRATYIAATPTEAAKVEVVCTGWNGLKIHCQGKAWELGKDDTFTSESQSADIMIDVQDTRVLLQWPKSAGNTFTPDTTSPGSENFPRMTARRQSLINSSPLRQQERRPSPVSPSPFPATSFQSSFPGHEDSNLVQVYEDEPSDVDLPDSGTHTQPTQSTQCLTQPLGTNTTAPQSPGEVLIHEDYLDHDEENDPTVHAFGPYGANLLPRLASFNTTAHPSSPPPRRQILNAKAPSKSLRQRSSPATNRTSIADAPTANHVINQLAYSRLASTPLSTIFSTLPPHLQPAPGLGISTSSLDASMPDLDALDALKEILDTTACIGEVQRVGKDAAGRALESEYYYVSELDDDEERRNAVVDGLRKPGLRACRKQHKQYYWRKPK